MAASGGRFAEKTSWVKSKTLTTHGTPGQAEDPPRRACSTEDTEATRHSGPPAGNRQPATAGLRQATGKQKPGVRSQESGEPQGPSTSTRGVEVSGWTK